MDGQGVLELLEGMPLAVSVLSIWRHIADESVLEGLFDKYRGRCYVREITFPTIVQLMADALQVHQGSGFASMSRALEAETLPASFQAAYGKIGRMPIRLSMGFLEELSDPLRSLFPAKARRQSPLCLQGFETIILDGKAIKNVAKRLAPLRGLSGGMLGGRALVAVQFSTGQVVAMHADPDGDANDARFVPDLLPKVRARIGGPRLYLADSGFCDLQRFEEFTQHGDHFLVRYHPKVGFHRDPSKPIKTGRDKYGRRFTEMWGWLGASTHPKRKYVRRIALERTGEADLVLMTDLLSSRLYPAEQLLEHYRQRWGIERVFQQVTEVFGLQGLIGTTPKATIFQFSFCLLLYNILQVVRGYVAANQQRDTESISIEKLHEDVTMQLTAWAVLLKAGILSAADIQYKNARKQRTYLNTLLKHQWSNRWIKSVNQKRRQHEPKTKGKGAHGSVERILHPRAAAKGKN
jgi:hypothetical protein